MSTDLQSEPDSRSRSKEGPNAFALVCILLLLSVATGVTRSALADAEVSAPPISASQDIAAR